MVDTPIITEVRGKDKLVVTLPDGTKGAVAIDAVIAKTQSELPPPPPPPDVGGVPVGTIAIWPGSKDNIPDKWEICDGGELAADSHPAFSYLDYEWVEEGRHWIKPDLTVNFLAFSQKMDDAGVSGRNTYYFYNPWQGHTHNVVVGKADLHTHSSINQMWHDGYMQGTRTSNVSGDAGCTEWKSDVRDMTNPGNHTHGVSITTMNSNFKQGDKTRPTYMSTIFIMKVE